jgi:predicted metalloprotease
MMAVALGLVLAGAACTQTADNSNQPVVTASSDQAKQTTTTGKTNDTKPPDAEGKPTETKRNKNAKSYKEALELAISDIQDYWTDVMPDVYGIDYEQIPKERLFPASEKKPGPACTPEGGLAEYEDVANNAFYCRLGRFVEWDDQDLMPRLYSEYGEYAVAMVFAHEWGHAAQDQLGNLGGKYDTILTENQADCFAGAWTKHSLENKSEKSFRANASDLTAALAGMMEFGDEPGGSLRDPRAHGTGFDRVNGFVTGFEQGPEKCAEFTDKGSEPSFIDLKFESPDDTGNVSYEDAIELATNDLNAYWKKLGDDAGFDFKTVESITAFSAETNMPKCGKKQYSEDEALQTIFFCVEDNYVAWDEDMLMDVSDGIGDMGIGVLLAKQWAVSAQVQDGQPIDQIKSKDGSLQQSCFTGAWTRAVLDGDEHNLTTDGKPFLLLSPGDLDEAIKAFLAFSDTPDTKGETSTGSAFEQVQAFRDGFLSTNGPAKCASYSTADQ